MATNTPAPETKLPKYRVLSPVDFNNKRFEPGKSISLDDETATPLLAVGAIESWGRKPDEEAAS